MFLAVHLSNDFLLDGTEKDEGKPTNKKDIVFYDRNGKNGKILTSAERKAQTKESGIVPAGFVYKLTFCLQYCQLFVYFFLLFQMELQRMKASLPT